MSTAEARSTAVAVPLCSAEHLYRTLNLRSRWDSLLALEKRRLLLSSPRARRSRRWNAYREEVSLIFESRAIALEKSADRIASTFDLVRCFFSSRHLVEKLLKAAATGGEHSIRFPRMRDPIVVERASSSFTISSSLFVFFWGDAPALLSVDYERRRVAAALTVTRPNDGTMA